MATHYNQLLLLPTTPELQTCKDEEQCDWVSFDWLQSEPEHPDVDDWMEEQNHYSCVLIAGGFSSAVLDFNEQFSGISPRANARLIYSPFVS